jgi:hypothetical protein
VITAIFLPAYFRGEMFTAYELMRRRFGDRIRKLTAGTFLLLRTLAEGVRVFAISIVVSIVLVEPALRLAEQNEGVRLWLGTISPGTGEMVSIA